MEQSNETSLNKVLAQLQLANAAICDNCEEESEDTFEVLLREALESENEAIKIYIKLQKKAETIGSNVLVKAFDELQKDEQKHIGNLQYLIKLLCEEAVQNEKEGEAEEAQLQVTENPEVE